MSNSFTILGDVMEKVIEMDEPFECIYCDSDNIHAGTLDGTMLSRQVTCDDCLRTWTECFRFIGVITDKEE